MYSLRKWIFRPKRSDQSLLAGFFYADEELNMVATELDSFDGRKDPERCTALVNQLRMCQDKVLNYIEKIMDECIPLERASRDFRVKFPDDVLQESLSGQLWFGAECLAAGSSIMNREVESASMRPLAKTLTRHLDYLRSLLRDQCLRNINTYTDRIKEALTTFDRLFAEFELSYVSAMVPVKTMKEYDIMQEVIVLFSETTQRALRLNLLTQDMVDDCDPALMFTIPRLAIVAGLLVYPEGPLNPDMDPVNMSEMFRPFQTLLYKIRELLWTLSKEELWMLEKSLCSTDEQSLINCHNSLLTYPDDFDPYENLIVDPSDSNLDGAIGPPELDIDDVLALATDSGRMLGVDQGDYGSMSQSPSTMTLVAQADPQCVSDGEADRSPSDSNCLHMPKKNMKHQDSTDSGMLSENGSILNSHNIPMTFETGNGESRSLRHSLSWPEPTLRIRRHRRQADRRVSVDLLDDNLETYEGPHPSYAHQSSHDFNLHLPLNTDSSMGTGPSSTWDQTPTNAVDLGSTRVFFTSDCFDTSPDPHSTQQISYVTETLNEVFVTDTSFQTSFISAVTSKALQESMGICCKCGNKTCLVSESYDRDSASQDDRKQDHFVDHLNEFNMSHGEQTSSSSSNGHRDHGHSSSNDYHPGRDCNNDSPHSTTVSTSTSAEQVTSPVYNSPGTPDSEVEKDRLESTEKSHTCKTPEITPGSSDINVVSGSNRNDAGQEQQRQSACDCQPYPNICDSTTTSLARESGHQIDAPLPSSALDSEQSARPEHSAPQSLLTVPRVQRFRYMDGVNMMCSVCNAKSRNRSRSPSVASTDVDWDRESYNSSETSSYNSECHDDEEIALAIQAAELASRREARSRFKSSNDLIHRLFVCISGVADQLQTNYASDLRHILKDVFECNSSEPFLNMEDQTNSDSSSAQSDPLPEELTDHQSEGTNPDSISANGEDTNAEDPPKWVPDEESPHCESCEALFTFVRRRHHCRNCGKIFCGRCSSNAVPLPHYGHTKPVRVCNRCFMFQVNPFTVDE